VSIQRAKRDFNDPLMVMMGRLTAFLGSPSRHSVAMARVDADGVTHIARKSPESSKPKRPPKKNSRRNKKR